MMFSAGAGYAEVFGDLGGSVADLKVAAAKGILTVSPEIDRSFENKLTVRSGTALYAELESRYEKGVPATRNDLTGYYVGRYVPTDNPNNIHAAFLFGRYPLHIPEEGPIGGNSKLMVSAILAINRKADYFDDIGYEHNYKISNSGLQKALKECAEALEQPAHSCNKETCHWYRKSGEDLVMKEVSGKKVIGYAYYFLKVIPHTYNPALGF
jgi:hypothetical protein